MLHIFSILYLTETKHNANLYQMWIFFSDIHRSIFTFFIAIVLDKTSTLVAVYFSMQNINQSRDLGLGRSNVDLSH